MQRSLLPVVVFLCILGCSGAASFPEPVVPFGVGVVVGSPCVTNADCELANAVCWPTTGNSRGESRCACEYGLTWDARNYRCDTPAALGRTITNITRAYTGSNAVRYEEQWAEVATPLTFPSLWHCDSIARYCWGEAEGVQFVSSIARNWWHLRYFVPGVTRVPLSHMIWRCAEGEGVYLSDSTAPTSVYGSGLRGASDHCSSCTTDGHWCGAHGTCYGDWKCTCRDGWSGERCELPPAAQVAAAVLPVGNYSDTIACNPFLPTSTCNTGEQCYIDLLDLEKAAAEMRPPRGVCACEAGRSRDPRSNSYVVITTDVNGGGESVYVEQFCSNTSTTATFVGAPVPTPGVGVADVAFLIDQPTSVWWSDEGGVLHVARTPIAADLHDPTWRPRNLAWHAARCPAGGSYFYPGSYARAVSGGVCSGATGVCGIGVNASASNPWTGTCKCLPNFMLDATTGRCDLCAANFTGYRCDQDITTCAVQKCSAAGFCLAGPLAYETYAYQLARLSGVRLDPSDDGTLGSTRAPDACICNDVAVVSPAAAPCARCSYLLRTPDNELIVSNTSRPLVIDPNSTPENVCQCSTGFGGDACNYSPSACRALKCGSAPGFTTTGDCVSSPVGTECNCVVVLNGTNALYGRKCTQDAPRCRQERCGGRGTCVLQNQGCECDAGWGGVDCKTPQCDNGQPANLTDSTCVCSPSFYGEFCQFWRCNVDSYLAKDGTCTCAGQWTKDAKGNCTLSTCGAHGRPRSGQPNSCVCKSYAAFSTASGAPYCRPKCPAGLKRTPSGDCICAFGTSGAVCETPRSDYYFSTSSSTSTDMFAVTLVMLLVLSGIAYGYYEATPKPGG